ncbi:MAG: hypothetical protein JST21_00560 [Bacteroidetes bacterium]|nr:hypothetical protein [Bacteroidota bacterium]
MIEQNEAKIFLANQRNTSITGWMRSCTLLKNNGNKKAFLSSLYNLHDDVLSARRTLSFITEKDVLLVILPLAGSIIYSDDCGNNAIIEAGKMQYFAVKKNTEVKIFNPYDEEYVNFLRLMLEPGCLNSIISTACFSFEREHNKNKLLQLFTGNPEAMSVKIFIGKFDGRKEALYKNSKPGNAIFVFVIEGAFEVQYRLLETRDALVLWDTDKIDMEALSNDAVLLLIDMPGK